MLVLSGLRSLNKPTDVLEQIVGRDVIGLSDVFAAADASEGKLAHTISEILGG